MLTLALALLWAPRIGIGVGSGVDIESGPAPRVNNLQLWMLPAALALILALVGGLIDIRGLLVLLAFAAACVAANRARGPLLTSATHAIMLTIGAGLFLHAFPGIDNPRVVTDAVLGLDAVPYTKYLNLDKGAAGLFLLGLYAPDRLTSDEGARHVPGLLWRFAVVVFVVMMLTLAFGYVRWDPKLPSWWPLWLWSMVALTALPEEAVFRALAQTWIARGLPGLSPRMSPAWTSTVATIAAGLLFGLAHFAGGPAYVVLATAAGIGYGWVYASTRSIAAAIATHAGLNAIHFFLFTYPALAR